MSIRNGWWLALLVPLGAGGCSDEASKSERPAPPPRAPAAPTFPDLPCSPSEPRTRRDDKTLACITTADVKVGPITCRAGKLVALYDDGRLRECTLARAHAYDGVPCRAGAPAKWFKSRKLFQCAVAEPYATGGVTCRGRINYHENGKLYRCELAEGAQLGQVEIPAESEIAFDDDGRPDRVKRPADAPLALGELRCAEAEYYGAGGVETCTLAVEATIFGRAAPVGAVVCFDERGTPTPSAGPDCFGSSAPVKGRP